MATNLEAIADILKGEGVQFTKNDEKNRIETGFRMPFYRDPEGIEVLGLIIRCEEDGDMLRIIAPFIYKCNRDNFPVVLQAMNEANRTFKFLKFQLDPADGEVRAELELPLEDALPTRRQFLRALMVFPDVIERCDPTFQAAVESGNMVPIEDPRELQDAFEEFLRSRRAQRDIPVTPALEE